MRLNTCRRAFCFALVSAAVGLANSALGQPPLQQIGQEKEPAGTGIDEATVNAYLKLGGNYGFWPENWSGMSVGPTYAGRGTPGFRFFAQEFPAAALPDVEVPFCLDLAKTGVKDIDLKRLAALKNLTKLSLIDTKITDLGLKELRPLRNLTVLYLSGTQVTDEGLKALALFQELRVLDLSKTPVTDKGLKAVAELKNLTYLDFWGTKVTEAGLWELAPCKRLTDIGWETNKITDQTIRILRDIGLLHALGCASKDGARPKSAAEVTVMDLHGTAITNASLEQVKLFTNLTALNLGSTAVTGRLTALFDFKDLTDLDLSNTKLTDETLNELGKIRKLSMLNLNNTEISAAGLKEIASLKNLTVLWLVNSKLADGGTIMLRRALPGCTIYPLPKGKHE